LSSLGGVADERPEVIVVTDVHLELLPARHRQSRGRLEVGTARGAVVAGPNVSMVASVGGATVGKDNAGLGRLRGGDRRHQRRRRATFFPSAEPSGHHSISRMRCHIGVRCQRFPTRSGSRSSGVACVDYRDEGGIAPSSKRAPTTLEGRKQKNNGTTRGWMASPRASTRVVRTRWWRGKASPECR
jgi:hypothetical protein